MMSDGCAGSLYSAPNFSDAVREAVRLTVLYREKFNQPDAPPYRVRKRRIRWSNPQYGKGTRSWRSGTDLWRVLTPEGRIPDRAVMKRLWRVTWVDRTGTPGTRHYQSKTAAMHRVDVLCSGVPEDPGAYGHLTGFEDGRPEQPPAAFVRVDRSDPVLFPADYASAIQRASCTE